MTGKAKLAAVLVPFVVLALVFLVGYVLIWKWMICRVYVPYGHSLVITRKTGASAAEDRYAKAEQKGVQRQMVGPGRHFFNPWTYDVKKTEDVVIEPRHIGVVKNNLGEDLPKGAFLAGPDQKGTQRRVLTPGRWRLNRHGQAVEIKDISQTSCIKPGYVGMQTLQEREDEQRKGIMRDVLQPGYYNINPRRIKIDIVEIGYHVMSIQTEFVQDRPKPNTGVFFPLADGKEMYLDFTVVWGVFPEEAPRIIGEYGTIDMVESKIIHPQVLSICKNRGSNLTTKQFIEGDTRETFQKGVTEKLQEMGKVKGIHILIALVRGFHPARDIKETIQARMIAEEEKKTLIVEERTDHIAAQLEQAEKIVDIALKDFDAETVALTAGERENCLKRSAQIKAEADRQVAALQKEGAKIDAEILRISGQAEARVTEAKKRADAQELSLQIEAFGGPEAFNLHTFAEMLPESLRIKYRYAGVGTLWTDLKQGLSDLAAKKILEEDNRSQRRPATRRRVQPQE